ncbi:unnamed protein product [Phaeothamnion confervicola]
MKIVAGSYEGFCYGWDADMSGGTAVASSSGAAAAAGEERKPAASLSFGTHVHQGCVKAVAMATSGKLAGRLLVTGGADERIRIFDLDARSEVGELQHHSGTINCLEFVGSTHLLSGSDDGTLCIWRVYDWALLHMLGGHKAAVADLCAHPSGRMALSVARDRTLRLWNLVEGRAAYIKRLPGAAELVRWSPAGDRFVVVITDALHIYDAATCAPVATCRHPVRVGGACFVPGGGNGGDGGGDCGDLVVTTADDNMLRAFAAATGEAIWEVSAADDAGGRVRALAFVPNAAAVVAAGVKGARTAEGGRDESTNGDGGGGGWIVTSSTAGVVRAWSVAGVGAATAVAAAAATDSKAAPAVCVLRRAVRGEPRFTSVAAFAGVIGGGGGITGSASGRRGKKRERKREEHGARAVAASAAEETANGAEKGGVKASKAAAQPVTGPANSAAAVPAPKKRKAEAPQKAMMEAPAAQKAKAVVSVTQTAKAAAPVAQKNAAVPAAQNKGAEASGKDPSVTDSKGAVKKGKGKRPREESDAAASLASPKPAKGAKGSDGAPNGTPTAGRESTSGGDKAHQPKKVKKKNGGGGGTAGGAVAGNVTINIKKQRQRTA